MSAPTAWVVCFCADGSHPVHEYAQGTDGPLWRATRDEAQADTARAAGPAHPVRVPTDCASWRHGLRTVGALYLALIALTLLLWWVATTPVAGLGLLVVLAAAAAWGTWLNNLGGRP